MTDADDRACWSAATAHAQAAVALLDDPSVPPWTAAVHLRRGFSALGRADGIAAPEAIAAALRDLEADDDTALDPVALRRLGAALSAAVGAAADARFDPGARRSARRSLLVRVLAGIPIAAAIVVVLVRTIGDFREGPWRAQYFATMEFDGPAVELREGDVRFDWHRGGPTPEMPRDQFSARFDTCMVLDEDLDAAFQLVSDDGARLYLDGALVVDNWGVHAEQARGADVRVAAGTHHLRVDYFEDGALAMVELRASLHGEVPDALPTRLLRYPRGEPGSADPCPP